jgi:DNA-binding MarR family transcriptional regulator
MPNENPFSEIRQVFHEPNRMAILSALLRSERGLAFGEIKAACELTDGNLSRHLRALENMKVIRLAKSFVDRKPRTTVSVTARGREQFLRYLDALESALKTAQAATEQEPGPSRSTQGDRNNERLSSPPARPFSAEGAGG